MGIVSVSSSASRTPLGFSTKFSTCRSTAKRPSIVAFKADKSNKTALVAPHEKIPLPIETTKEKKRHGKSKKSSDRLKAVRTQVSPCTLDVDYNEAAAKLENIYRLSPGTDTSDVEDVNGVIRRRRQRKRKTSECEKENDGRTSKKIVRNPAKRAKRLSLQKRIALRINSDEKLASSVGKKKGRKNENEKIDELVREYSSSTDLVSLDWKKMKIPPVLSSSEHVWLFKMMQPMKAFLQVKEHLQENSGREPTEGELAEATKMDVLQMRKQIEVGRAARNKLIKHNLRLVLFVIKKYFQEFANGPRYQDLCQAGVKGLMTAIDRFEPKRRFRLSTYGLFWIRHTIIRSMTLSSFTRVSFGLESIRSEIQKAKLELWFQLKRKPMEEEIIEKVGISIERYREVMRASKPVLSLHSRHKTTQEELISGVADVDGGDDRRQSALLRLALDDVIDSLKPKESLVVRQRFGLDGKGDRTLGEIAGNLNISREMVRKHEVKALMKLKHPTRVDYLRRHVV
ncbi:hypothetical protein DKX38_021912 [Salix brachista]|uniref:RNA polymerase sigma-70 domain-containing protein n=1 Tax=Salix brachista TaxID=2182728 RepID=A0A5N5K2Z1_9ROSI|nr:hypothetical protein DKX38_021912 [Salix brachista]